MSNPMPKCPICQRGITDVRPSSLVVVGGL
jgi:hypothetical protein